MKFAVVPGTPMSAGEVVDFAAMAEDAGFWGVGIPDTPGVLFPACYPTVTAALLRTREIHVGPHVTNPVTQHWFVHAATARALESLAPDRFFLGIATGDHAVISAGLRPAKLAEFEAAIGSIREIAPPALRVMVAASGRKSTLVAGRVATDLELGVGLHVDTLRRFAARARAERQAVGRTDGLGVWAQAVAIVVEYEEQVAQVKLALRALVYALSRFCFASSVEDKGVPEELQPALVDRLRRYDHIFRGGVGEDNPNSGLFDDRPDLRDYLTERMVAVGTADQVREKLTTVARDAELDGLWVANMSSPFEEDWRRNFERLAAALEPELR
jgi:alkanesulfonate monooxygenase SsuD/methylene tetrahydromethanopterin reductase-like flavin-dependent oxidoreductase (luciferase family)